MHKHRLWHTLLDLWTVVPWTLLLWLGEVIACRRWSGLWLTASLVLSTAAAFHGWRLVWRWSERQHDLIGARLLRIVPDPAPWERVVHPVQTLKAAHLSHCQRRWGVNARSSGWKLMERAGRLELAGVPVCMALAVHPWWLTFSLVPPSWGR